MYKKYLKKLIFCLIVITISLILFSSPAFGMKGRIVGSIDTYYAADVSISGPYAYVADGGDGIKVIDISNPSNPTIVGSVDTPQGASDVFVWPLCLCGRL